MPAPKSTKGVPTGTVRGRYRLVTRITISEITGRKVRTKRWVLTAAAKVAKKRAAAKETAAAKRRGQMRRR